MARGWIKMRKALRASPKVRRMARQLGVAPIHALGLLTAFWIWADDAATEDGLLPGLELADVDDEFGVDGFASAMLEAAWLALGDDGLSIPEFDAYLGEKHRKRAAAAARQRKSRARRKAEASRARHTPVTRDSHVSVTPMSHKTETQSVNTPSECSPPTPRAAKARPDWRAILAETQFGSVAAHPGFADAFAEFLAYRAEQKLKPWVERTYRAQFRLAKKDPAGFLAALDEAMTRGWQGHRFGKDGPVRASGLPSERSGLMSASEAVALSRARRAQQGAPEGPRDVDPERPFRLVSGE